MGPPLTSGMEMDPASAFSFDMSYCGSPPTLDTLWGRWNFEPILLIVLALSALAGALLQPGSGATPLLTIMVMSAAGSLASILWVLRRERRVGTIRHTTTGS